MHFEDVATESRLQAQGQVEHLTDLHADRLKIYDHFTDAVNKFKNTKVLLIFPCFCKKNTSNSTILYYIVTVFY